MKYFSPIIFTLILAFAFCSCQPKIKASKNLQSVTCTDTAGIRKFFLSPPKKTGKTTELVDYYWYSNSHLGITHGGYDGKLLHDKYRCFYTNGNLKQSGAFFYGRKHGQWNTWNTNGKLLKTSNWKKGKLHGWQIFYDEQNNIVRKQKYRNNKLVIKKKIKLSCPKFLKRKSKAKTSNNEEDQED